MRLCGGPTRAVLLEFFLYMLIGGCCQRQRIAMIAMTLAVSTAFAAGGGVVPVNPMDGVAMTADNAHAYIFTREVLRYFKHEPVVDFQEWFLKAVVKDLVMENNATFVISPGDYGLEFGIDSIGIFTGGTSILTQKWLGINVSDIAEGYEQMPWERFRDTMIENFADERKEFVRGAHPDANFDSFVEDLVAEMEETTDVSTLLKTVDVLFGEDYDFGVMIGAPTYDAAYLYSTSILRKQLGILPETLSSGISNSYSGNNNVQPLYKFYLPAVYSAYYACQGVADGSTDVGKIQAEDLNGDAFLGLIPALLTLDALTNAESAEGMTTLMEQD